MSKGGVLEIMAEILEKSISDESTLIERDKKIKDLDGITRQIDIYITTFINKRKFITAIECKNYLRNIPIEKIEAFSEKCNRLPNIHKKIFLTSSNFQSGAVNKAKSLNIDLYRITEEQKNASEELNLKSISFIAKRSELLKLCYDPSRLPKISGKVYLCDANGEVINKDEIKNRLLENTNLWDFLLTNKGLLINYKKIIYPTFRTNNLYLKDDNGMYEIYDIQAIIELEFSHEERSVQTLKSYFSYADNTTLATFSDIEFNYDSNRYKFCVVNVDENDKKMFIISRDSKNNLTQEKLVNFGKLDFEIKPYVKRQTNSKRVNPLLFNLPESVDLNIVNNEDPKGIALQPLRTYTFIHQNKFGFMIPLTISDKLITARFPEPISLYFAHSIELFKVSEEYKLAMVNYLPENEGIRFQDKNYYIFLSYRISSFHMLNNAIVAFVNYNIPDNLFVEIDGYQFTKPDAIAVLTLDDKINLIPNEIKNRNNEITVLLNLNSICLSLQNLSISQVPNPSYMADFEKLLSFDIESCFDIAESFFKKIDSTFILFG